SSYWTAPSQTCLLTAKHFEESKQAAQGLSEKWGVSKAFENTRTRKVKVILTN
ncbi:Hypothetical protein FKW44_010898, partial [Caligus rogercresseyi]